MTFRARSYFHRLSFAVALWLLAVTSVAAVQYIEINLGDDAQMTPYATEVLWQAPLIDQPAIALHPFLVLAPSYHSDSSAELILGLNPATYLGDPSILKAHGWPGFTIIDENPVPLQISDLTVLPVPDTAPRTVAGTGVRNDSGFFYLYQPHPEIYREYYACHGTDLNGDGRWPGILAIMGTVDVTGDGHDEMMVFVSASRDGPPRELLCIDVFHGRILWRVAVVSLIAPLRGMFIFDQEPRIRIATACPGQGFSDSLAYDRYSYYLTLTSEGQLRTQTIVGRYPECGFIAADSGTDVAYLYHTIVMTHDTAVADTATLTPYLSKIAADGTILKQIRIPEFLKHTWMQDFHEDGTMEFCALSKGGVLRIYDSSLTLIAESGVSKLVGLAGYGPPLAGHSRTLLLREANDKMFLCTENFEPLAIFPAISYGEVLQELPADTVVMAFANRASLLSILRFRPRPISEYVMVLFNRYRIYILAALCSLFVGLVIVNYYRMRTRRTLTIISDQKIEIERTHVELKEAQQKIIEAEKYRQAQDIAGGFAHEIRNALLPAQIIHQKLQRRHPDETETVDRAEQAVRRALDLTELVTKYSRLESKERAQALQLSAVWESALKDMRERLESGEIAVETDIDESIMVHADPEHIRLIFSNLLANACDALKDQPARGIVVRLTHQPNWAVIEVTDSGSGIDPAILPRMFSPFVSGKPLDGHGLGLSLVSRVVAMYGGATTAENIDKGGARLTVKLPLYTPSRT